MDLIVTNNAETMGKNMNSIEIIRKDETSVEFLQKSKQELAYDIIKMIAEEFEKGSKKNDQ